MAVNGSVKVRESLTNHFAFGSFAQGLSLCDIERSTPPLYLQTHEVCRYLIGKVSEITN